MVLPGDEEVRPFVAAALVNAGWAGGVLLITNVPSSDEIDGLTISTHDRSQRVLLNRGVSDQQIEILQQGSQSTHGDATAISKYLEKHPNQKLAIVTSFYHLRRTRIVMDSVLNSTIERIVFVSVPADGVLPNNWWKAQKGIVVILTEYLKLFVYWIVFDTGKYVLLISAIIIGWPIYRCCNPKTNSRRINLSHAEVR